jgi:hypothetical protein
VSERGFHWPFTIRDTSGAALVPKLAAFEEMVLRECWSRENSLFKEEVKPTRTGGRSKSPYGSQVLAETTCATCGAPATRKSGSRKDKSWWEGIFCSAGEESHKIWLK